MPQRLQASKAKATSKLQNTSRLAQLRPLTQLVQAAASWTLAKTLALRLHGRRPLAAPLPLGAVSWHLAMQQLLHGVMRHLALHQGVSHHPAVHWQLAG